MQPRDQLCLMSWYSTDLLELFSGFGEKHVAMNWELMLYQSPLAKHNVLLLQTSYHHTT